jgi:hypothetical protein
VECSFRKLVGESGIAYFIIFLRVIQVGKYYGGIISDRHFRSAGHYFLSIPNSGLTTVTADDQVGPQGQVEIGRLEKTGLYLA